MQTMFTWQKQRKYTTVFGYNVVKRISLTKEEDETQLQHSSSW